MATQLPDHTFPTHLYPSFYWRALETHKVHFPDSLAYWILIGFCPWERMNGDWKVGEKEKAFFSCFW